MCEKITICICGLFHFISSLFRGLFIHDFVKKYLFSHLNTNVSRNVASFFGALSTRYTQKVDVFNVLELNVNVTNKNHNDNVVSVFVKNSYVTECDVITHVWNFK